MTERPDPKTLEAIRVRQAYEADLLAKANVLGVGVGMRRRRGESTEEVAVVVLVSRKIPAAQLAPRDVIPRQIEGVPVDVLEVGEIRAGSD
jgi:hypothetical protein